MKITVTRDDIKAGHMHAAMSCPIALALKRATGREYVLVSGTGQVSLGYLDGCAMGQYRLPRLARWFIKLFDGGWWVPAFSFELKGL